MKTIQQVLGYVQGWQQAIAWECGKIAPVGELSTFAQLCWLFDDELGAEHDEQLRKRLTQEYDLHVSIEKGDICHLPPTVKAALKLCEDILKACPNSIYEDFDIKKIDKSKYGFSQRGEQAVFQIYRNTNATIVELQVRRQQEKEELVYWTKNKLFIMSFVPELDKEHSVSIDKEHSASIGDIFFSI